MPADVPNIDGPEAIEARARGAVWVDVREHHEWTRVRIADTHHIPMDAAVTDVPARWPDITTEIVLSCQSGVRSAAVARHLRSLGYARVYNLRNGILGWARDGHPVERG